MYGLLLARTARCPEALPISQALVASVPDDEDAQFNAQQMVLICEGQGGGQFTATPIPANTPEPIQATPSN
jgi:hypothetical protein